jgi:hypothetical protein
MPWQWPYEVVPASPTSEGPFWASRAHVSRLPGEREARAEAVGLELGPKTHSVFWDKQEALGWTPGFSFGL